MKLYLSSYRLGNNTDELSDWIKEHGNKILVIPNAVDAFPDGERKTAGILDKCKDLEEIGFETKILDLRNYFGDFESLKADIENYNAFYVIGENVFCLRRAMKLSGFDEYLKTISDNPNYLYSGFSAGICVLAEDLHGIHLADQPEVDPYNYGSIIWDGVGIINYMPVPHFDTPEHPESQMMYEVVKYLEDNNLPYITLKDGEVITEKEYSKKMRKL